MKSAQREECLDHNFQAGGEGMKSRPCLGKRKLWWRESMWGPVGMWVRRKKLVWGILVFSSGSLVKMNHFYCSLAKLRPFGQIDTLKIVCWLK